MKVCFLSLLTAVRQVSAAGNISVSWPHKVPMKFVTGPHTDRRDRREVHTRHHFTSGAAFQNIRGIKLPELMSFA